MILITVYFLKSEAKKEEDRDHLIVKIINQPNILESIFAKVFNLSLNYSENKKTE